MIASLRTLNTLQYLTPAISTLPLNSKSNLSDTFSYRARDVELWNGIESKELEIGSYMGRKKWLLQTLSKHKVQQFGFCQNRTLKACSQVVLTRTVQAKLQVLLLTFTNGLLQDLLPYTHRMFSSIDIWLMLRIIEEFIGSSRVTKLKRDARLLYQLARKLSKIENTAKLRLLLQHLRQFSCSPMASTISLPFLRPLPLPRLTSMHRLNRQISSHPCLRTQGLCFLQSLLYI